jgi:hypothetical protein
LDPRLEFHHQRAVAARMSPGSAIAVLVVHAGDCLDRAGAPRAVSARRRRRARGADASARRLSGLAARGSTASGTTRSTAIPARSSGASPTVSATSGGSPIPASGRCATGPIISLTRR